MRNMKTSIKAYSYESLISLLCELGEPKFRADQIVQWLYAQGVHDYQEMTNLSKSLREKLSENYPIDFPEILNRQISKDGTRKYVLGFADETSVETVAIPSSSTASTSPTMKNKVVPDLRFASPEHTSAPSESFSSLPNSVIATKSKTSSNLSVSDGDSKSDPEGNLEDSLEGNPKGDSPRRLTVCVSSQIGCPMECSFCATGKEGFTRNLLPGEIVDQILVAQSDIGIRANNVVVMGQGEPFLNYENTLAALRFINSAKGLEIGARRITVSTCGLIEGIRKFSCEPEQFTLAVSLHSAEQAVRDQLMPRIAKDKLPLLKEALLDYVATTKRRVTLEYILMKDLNDSPQALSALKNFCEGLLCHVNLLTFNKTEGSDFFSPPPSVFKNWLSNLEAAGIPATMRNSRGADIAGACGQLKNSH